MDLISSLILCNTAYDTVTGYTVSQPDFCDIWNKERIKVMIGKAL